MGSIILYGLLFTVGFTLLRMLVTPSKASQPVVYVRQEPTQSQSRGSGSLLLFLIGIALIIFVAIA
ncbi:MAG: hypothetical protein MI924_35270 [Chloroflexales bacterium]|nr:hypothetical protein [Chloroflexales bacterium]